MSKELSTQDNRREELETMQQERWLAPLVDVFENEDELLLRADLPGVSHESLNVHLEKNQLLIEAKRTLGDVAGQPLGRELVDGSFRRVFELPGGIDGGKVTAELKDGVVTIHLPKADALKPRKIAIKAG